MMLKMILWKFSLDAGIPSTLCALISTRKSTTKNAPPATLCSSTSNDCRQPMSGWTVNMCGQSVVCFRLRRRIDLIFFSSLRLFRGVIIVLPSLVKVGYLTFSIHCMAYRIVLPHFFYLFYFCYICCYRYLSQYWICRVVKYVSSSHLS